MLCGISLTAFIDETSVKNLSSVVCHFRSGEKFYSLTTSTCGYDLLVQNSRSLDYIVHRQVNSLFSEWTFRGGRFLRCEILKRWWISVELIRSRVSSLRRQYDSLIGLLVHELTRTGNASEKAFIEIIWHDWNEVKHTLVVSSQWLHSMSTSSNAFPIRISKQNRQWIIVIIS